jgi:uncharacterized protein (TIGR02246 family)
MTVTETQTAAIQALITSSNRAWLEGDTEDLRELLHPDVVFLNAQLEVLAEGREACLQSYEHFVSQAKLHRFDEEPATVQIVGGTAVASYHWSIAYSLADRRYEERGRDMLVCVRSGSKWQIIWRAQFSSNRA